MKCILCGEVINGYGNNAWPVKDEGRCCNKCNYDYLIPYRRELYNMSKLKSESKLENN